MANYPTSAPSFATRNNGGTIEASHINSLQDEVAAIGGGLVNGLAHVLTSTGGVRLQFKQSMARATSTGALPVANNAVTTLDFGAEEFDTDSLHDNAVNPSRLTAQVAGKYQVTANVVWSANSSGVRQVRLLRNSSLHAIAQDPATVVGTHGMCVSELVALTANAFVQVAVFQDSGSTASLSQASLAMVYVGE